MEIDKLINKNVLAEEFGLKPGSIRENNPHKKYYNQLRILNALIESWRNTIK